MKLKDARYVEFGGTVMMYGSAAVSAEDKGNSIALTSWSVADGYAGDGEDGTADCGHFDDLLKALSELQFDVEEETEEDDEGFPVYTVVESGTGNGATEWYLSIDYRDGSSVNFVGYDSSGELFKKESGTLNAHIEAFGKIREFLDGV